jgi:ElaB/YqjD/DUF883 family membrane-anchored ribosome-binding protein
MFAHEHESDAIRKDLVQTKTRIGDTLAELETRLQPTHLAGQALGAAAGGADQVVTGARNASAAVMDKIRNNPMSLALLEVGLDWVVQQLRRAGPGVERLQEQASQMAGDTHDKVGDLLQQARASASDTRSNAGDLLQQSPALAALLGLSVSWLLTQGLTVMDRASQTGERAEAVAEQARAQIQEIGAEAQLQAQRAEGWLLDTLRENPLAIVAIGLAVGGLAGFILPTTEQERKMLESAREHLMLQAETALRDALHSVLQTAFATPTPVSTPATTPDNVR